MRYCGIPVVSVNTSLVQVKINRIGDRNLIDTVLGKATGFPMPDVTVACGPASGQR